MITAPDADPRHCEPVPAAAIGLTGEAPAHSAVVEVAVDGGGDDAWRVRVATGGAAAAPARALLVGGTQQVTEEGDSGYEFVSEFLLNCEKIRL